MSAELPSHSDSPEGRLREFVPYFARPEPGSLAGSALISAGGRGDVWLGPSHKIRHDRRVNVVYKRFCVRASHVAAAPLCSARQAPHPRGAAPPSGGGWKRCIHYGGAIDPSYSLSPRSRCRRCSFDRAGQLHGIEASGHFLAELYATMYEYGLYRSRDRNDVAKGNVLCSRLAPAKARRATHAPSVGER